MAKIKSTDDKNMSTLGEVLELQEIMSRLQVRDRLPTEPSAPFQNYGAQPWSEQKAMGWLRELPDCRDYTIHTEIKNVSENRRSRGVTRSVKDMADQMGVLKAPALPPSVNLTKWFSPVEDQGTLGSCTANAGVGILEYFERKAFGTHLDASRLFLYKATRNLLNWTGDTGAYLRTTMEALTIFGVCPEKYWPYRVNGFDTEPSAFCYSFAQNYQSISYFRHDAQGITPDELLQSIKTWLAAGVPAMFGFTCYSSIDQANVDGMIPFPVQREEVVGGHAVVAAGYDDTVTITNRNNGYTTTGAFLIRNSWGTGWGNKGYGWLPYEYVLRQLAVDWWSLLKAEWVDTGKFNV
jgi:C1A family cysteine protease